MASESRRVRRANAVDSLYHVIQHWGAISKEARRQYLEVFFDAAVAEARRGMQRRVRRAPVDR